MVIVTITPISYQVLCNNMDNANIARLESGNTNPTIRTLYKISRGLNVKLKELVDVE